MKSPINKADYIMSHRTRSQCAAKLPPTDSEVKCGHGAIAAHELITKQDPQLCARKESQNKNEILFHTFIYMINDYRSILGVCVLLTMVIIMNIA